MAGRMKLGALAAVATIALVVPGQAEGAKKKYDGAFETSGLMSFVLTRDDGRKEISNFKWEGFPLACQGGPATSSSFLAFDLMVRNRRFSAIAVDRQDDPGARLVLEGVLVGPRNAKGTMRIEGNRVPVDGGGKRRCDSGKVDWTASRSAAARIGEQKLAPQVSRPGFVAG